MQTAKTGHLRALLGLLLALAVLPAPAVLVAGPPTEGVVVISDGGHVSENLLPGEGVVSLGHEPLYDESYLVFRRDQGDGRGYNDGFFSLGVFAPVYKFEFDHLAFTNTRFNFTDDGQLAANVGLGWRKLLTEKETIVGASVWFDTDESDRRVRYNQWAFGLELLRENFDLRTNFYNPTSHGEHDAGVRLGTIPFFRGNQILFQDFRFAESALTSADVELGVPMPGHPWLKGYAGAYWYDSEERTNKFGVKGRLRAYLSDAAAVELSISEDPLFGTNLAFAVSYSIGKKWQPLRPYHKKPMHQRLYEQVPRTDRIPNRTFLAERRDSPAINPRTGVPFFVVHVDDSNPAAPGTGTFENPLASLAPAGPTGADLILVRRGTTSRANLLPGGTTLMPNQRLLGEGVPHFFTARRGTFLLPESFARDGQLPFVGAPDGTDLVTLADNNEVSALNLITPGGGANAIAGAGIADFNINNINNDIDLAAAPPMNNTGLGGGIVLTNATGTGTIDTVRFNSTAAGSPGSVVVENTGAGPLALAIDNVAFARNGLAGIRLLADGSDIDTTLRNVNVSQSDVGLQMVARGGGRISANVSDSTFNGNMRAGISSNIRDAGSRIDLTAEDVQALNNGTDGILFDAGMGGSFAATVTDSVLDNNARNAFRAVLAGGASGTLSVADVSGTGSGEHGVFVSVTDSTLNSSTFTRVDASDSGQLGMVGLADAFNFDVTNSQAAATIVDSTGINTPGNMTQENGLRVIADGGSALTMNVSGTNFSNNTISGLNMRIRDMGTTVAATFDNLTLNNNAMDGFLYDVSMGSFTATLTDSTIDGSGRNGIRAVGGASPAFIDVTVDTTLVDNSGAEGVFFDIDSGGANATFNFTYLPNPPSAVLNSGAADGVFGRFDGGAGMTGTVDFNGITIDGNFDVMNMGGANVTISP